MTLGANQIGAYAADLFDLEEKIEQLQTGKRDLYKAIRDEHGKGEATSLKLAVKLSRMDDGKRSEAEAIDTEAQRMLAIIAKGRAPRATRESARDVPDHSSDLRNMVSGTTQEANDAEAFDAETGEFTTTHNSEPATHAADRGGEGDDLDWLTAFSAEPITNTPEASGTARKAPGGTAPSNGIADLSQAVEDQSSAGGPVAQSADPRPAQHGAQPAPHTSIQSDDPTEPAGEGPKTLAGRPNSSGEAQQEGAADGGSPSPDPAEVSGANDGGDDAHDLTQQAGGVANDAPPVLHPAALNALKLRPWCLHANDLPKCAGVGKKHCFTCQKAHADAEGETA